MEFVQRLKYWFEQKLQLNTQQRAPFFREGQTWMCQLGLNVGHEQNGGGKMFLRPVIILKKFSDKTALVLPLTSVEKKNLHTKYEVVIKNHRSFVLFEQARVIDSKRLHYKKQTLRSEIFKEIRDTFKNLL